jgi:hypothetical protein
MGRADGDGMHGARGQRVSYICIATPQVPVRLGRGIVTYKLVFRPVRPQPVAKDHHPSTGARRGAEPPSSSVYMTMKCNYETIPCNAYLIMFVDGDSICFYSPNPLVSQEAGTCTGPGLKRLPDTGFAECRGQEKPLSVPTHCGVLRPSHTPFSLLHPTAPHPDPDKGIAPWPHSNPRERELWAGLQDAPLVITLQ